ncbi:MAG: hypothetical protein A2V74_08590 [Acidobacteria bacterium RBG_16_70_10]|nr:MAG: hypothetical protein A2V74_08590 [Acidobacteria bacterium RBG_16_70_10]
MSERSLPADQIPETIGRYKIVKKLGSGAMAEVYQAYDPLIKRTLAVKTIRFDIPRDSPSYRTFLNRFYQEARISGTLSHPNIVTLFDIGDENGLPFLAMEYVEGPTMAQMLEKGERFRPEKVIALVSQVASALDYAHSRSIVHRDIKPSNLIVYGEDRIKVTDFGIAKLAEADLTQAGTLVGTPSYMSPEQAMGEKLDGRSDIFSLGVCAFEMLSGEQPFPGSNVTSILYRLVHVDPIEPGNLLESGLVPEKWHEVFNRVLAKKPENRYPTAGAFVQDLELCQGSWFTGLGDDTVTMVSPPVLAEATATLPQMEVAETIRAASAATAGSSAGAASSAPDPAGQEPTVVLGPAAETVVLAPGASPKAAVSDTQPMPVPPPLPSRVPARAPATPRPGRPRAWLWGAAAVLTLSAIAGAWVLWPKGGQDVVAAPTPVPPPPTPAPAPPPATGSLRVETEPSGARVLVDGQDRGTTPLDLADLSFGEHQVRLELSGFEPQTHRVAVSGAAPSGQLQAALTKVAPATGGADFLSSPPGAAVLVDGRAVGQTPLSDLQLKPGSHQLEIDLEGYEPWVGVVHVTPGSRARVEASLRPLLRVTPPPAPPPVDTSKVYANTPKDVDTLARKVSGESPSYPSDRAPRLRSGERVSVTVSFVVTENGEVEDVTIEESGGRVIDEVVASAIRGWKFQPARKRGTLVKVRTIFKQTFLGG